MRGNSSCPILHLVFFVKLSICVTFPVCSINPFGPVSAFVVALSTNIVVVVTVVVLASVPITTTTTTTVEGHGS